MKKALLLVLLSLFVSIEFNGQTTYTYSGNGEWGVQARWFPSYPGETVNAGDTVIFEGQDITIDNGNNIFNRGTIILKSGATLTIKSAAPSDPDPNYLTSPGVTVVEAYGELVVEERAKFSTTSALYPQGSLQVHRLGRFTNYGSFITFWKRTQLSGWCDGFMVNYGTLYFNQVNGFTINQNGYFTNRNYAVIANTSGLNNYGNVQNFGNLVNAGTFRNYNRILNNTPNTISNQKSFINQAGGVVDNKGTFTNKISYFFTNEGSFRNFSGVLNFDNTSGFSSYVTNKNFIDNRGNSTINFNSYSPDNEGTIVNQSGSSINGTSTLYNNNNGIIDNYGTVNATIYNQGFIRGNSFNHFGIIKNQNIIAPRNNNNPIGSYGISGSSEFEFRSSIEIELLNTNTHDKVRFNSSLPSSERPRINVTLLNGFVPAAGDQFVIVEHQGLTPGFINLPTLPPSIAWETQQNTNNITLKVVCTPSTVECAQDVTVTSDIGLCTASNVILPTPNVFSCTTYTATNDAPLLFPIGDTEVTWTITTYDTIFTCSQIVTVTDINDPTMTCSADILVSASPNSCESFVNIVPPSIDLFCDSVVYGCTSPVTFNTIGSGLNVSLDNTFLTLPMVEYIAQSIEIQVVVNGPFYETGERFMFEGPDGNLLLNKTRIRPECVDTTYPITITPSVWNSWIDTYGTDLTFKVRRNVGTKINLNDPNCGNYFYLCTPFSGAAEAINDYNNSTDASDTYPVGTTTINWTYVADNGNTVSCSQDITVEDTELPSVTCKNSTVALDSNGMVTVNGIDLDNGSTDNCSIASYEIAAFGMAPSASFTFDCSNVGTNTVSLVVTDVYGNSNQCTAQLTIEDPILPTTNCIDIIVQLDINGEATINPSDIDNTSFDNCGIATYSIDKENFTCDDVGVNTVILTVIDNNGNSNQCTATVTVEDPIAPQANCVSDLILSLDENGVVNFTASDIDSGSTDACGIASMEIFPTQFDCDDIGFQDVVLVLVDNNGNTSECTSLVTVQDVLPPTPVCKDITVQLDSTGQIAITAEAINDGSYDNCAVDSTSIDIQNFTCSNLGENTVTLTVNDVNGNSATCTAIVTVEDSIAPQIICPADVTVECDEDNSPIATGVATTTDNCSATVSFNDVVVPGIGSNETILRTWTATDIGGNQTSCVQTIEVVDTTPPVSICQDITVQLDENGNASIIPENIDNESFDNCGDITFNISQNNFNCDDIGTNIVTLTTTDENGNTSTCLATVTIIDSTPPVIICPADLTIECDDDPSPANTGMATATDNCDTAPVITFTDVVVAGVGSNSTITRTWTATDANGNASSCDQVIEVVDTTPPTPVCMDITVSLDENGMYVLNPSEIDGGSTDNCDPAPSLFVFPDTFTCDDIGTNNVTLTVTDANGNANVCGAIVTVVDDTPPTISCPADITVSADAGMCDATVSFGPAVALDNCNVTVTQTDGPLSGTSFPVGTTVVAFTATDAGGNSTVCTFNVTVTDDELPAAVCQDITVALDEFGAASIMASDVDGGSTDNCAIDTLSIDIDTFDCSNVGPNNVVLTVTDVNGNVNTCTAVVTVEDTTAPLAICQNITVQLDANGMVSIVPSDVDGGSSDACGIDTLTVDIDTFDCSNVGANDVVLTVTDVNGNSSTCTATVTVEDTIAPTLVCQPATITIGPDGTATVDPLILLDQTNPLDNCTIDSLATNAGTLDCSDVGSTITVTVFAVDANGNIASCETTLTIEDSLGPVFDQGTLPEDTSRDPEPNGIYTLEDFTVGVAASDNCSDPLLPIVIAQDPAPGTPLGVGVYDITLTAMDDLGNETDYIFELTVNPILGVEDTNFTSLSLYPNPASDMVTLSNPNNLELQEVAIYDLMGRLVNTIKLMDMGTERNIDVSLLQSATYLIVIKGKQGITTKQLIIE
ncbi:HYR domain-containing protein [Patiriisocius hiemis]|uniref:HYR domain-containing protein n=1 Tax=Patiriisocius hiemis TaxID=3075604 RepID=A0ABU2Y8L0_9FLAO|nr:HYR domain-containing protein [Constantimarinum sp. W242]MDT0554382.1 HYR domain-containing protein [Constantimarinum sp. W242]